MVYLLKIQNDLYFFHVKTHSIFTGVILRKRGIFHSEKKVYACGKKMSLHSEKKLYAPKNPIQNVF